MKNKPCYPRGFYIYKIFRLRVLESMVLNITLPSSEWDIKALEQIKEADNLLFEKHNAKQ